LVVKRVLLRLLLGWLSAIALLLVAGEAGLRLNTSASVPRGFYWLVSEQPALGAYVAVCPPRSSVFELARERGYLGPGRCSGGSAELIKVFAAGPGDRVRIDASGVRIGDRLWPNSAPKAADAAGRPLPRAPMLDARLSAASVLVMSQDCALGFDARYFGPLSRSAIVGTAVPLITW
jgi:conjugative transfer signal peptidase TraF